MLKKYNYRLVYSTAVIDACKKKKNNFGYEEGYLRAGIDEIFKKKESGFTKSREI